VNQLEVQIMGQSYRLGCPEDGAERLQAAVLKVDAAMCAIRDAGKVKARDRIAVLAALNLAFELPDPPPSTSTAIASNTPVDGPLTAMAPATQQPASAAAGTAGPLGNGAEGEDPQLTSLLARLDDALRDDGRLL
jgi:cell division protein ZapA